MSATMPTKLLGKASEMLLDIIAVASLAFFHLSSPNLGHYAVTQARPSRVPSMKSDKLGVE